jgi:hypothetical protein
VNAAQSGADDKIAPVFGGESQLAVMVHSIVAEPNYAFVSWWKTSRLGQPTGNEKLVLGVDGCLHARNPMDTANACGQLVSVSASSSGNGHRDGDVGPEAAGTTTL